MKADFPRMTRRSFCQTVLGGLGALAVLPGACTAPESQRKPNVLLILTDDQGYGDIRSHGNDKIDTPTMDRFSQEGVRFDRFFVSPLCAPTRASLLTGRYHLRTGASGVTRGLENMRSEEVTIAEVLKQNGYATGCFGKWHNGAHYPENPNGQGFDEFFGFCGGVWFNYFDSELEHNGEMVKTEGYITDVLTDKAIEFIRKNRDRPFFCYVPYNAPHTPCQVPDKYFDKYVGRGLDEKNACFYGMIENIDDNFERILGKLREFNLEEDTIVIFITDNGPNGNRYNANMRGKKSSVDEGGVRVPCFIRWPERLQPGMLIEENASHIDMLPTIADLCGVPVGKTLPLDGKSVKPLMEGQSEGWQDRMIFTFPALKKLTPQSPGAVRTQRWRAIKSKGNWKLYDIMADPEQKTNIANQHPGILTKLSAAYEKALLDVTKDGLEALPIQAGHPGWPNVELPGHEAHLISPDGKGIAYNYGPGYTNHWIAKWTSADAYPQWNIKVVRSGLYEVTLMYVCAQEDVGVEVRVEASGERLDGVIQEAHDPEPLPSPFRMEEEAIKYMRKEWKPLTLGRINLTKGRTSLVVRALKIPGHEAMDLKAVRLKYVAKQ